MPGPVAAGEIPMGRTAAALIPSRRRGLHEQRFAARGGDIGLEQLERVVVAPSPPSFGIVRKCASGVFWASSANDRSISDCSRAVVAAQLVGPVPTYGWPGVLPHVTKTTPSNEMFLVVEVDGP